jgi:hypothetical protein
VRPIESTILAHIEKDAGRNREVLRQIEAGFRFQEYGVDFTDRKREDAMRRLVDCEEFLSGIGLPVRPTDPVMAA